MFGVCSICPGLFVLPRCAIDRLCPVLIALPGHRFIVCLIFQCNYTSPYAYIRTKRLNTSLRICKVHMPLSSIFCTPST